MLPFFISIFCQQFIGEGQHAVNEKEKTDNSKRQAMDNQSPIDRHHRY
jgi:hypothetical protein